MRQILDEYGEVVIGMIGAVLIIGIACSLFQNDGIIIEYMSNYANSSI